MTPEAGTGPMFVRDAAWQRVDASTLLAGSPLTLFRVTGAGSRILDALTSGAALPAGHEALTRRLLAAGAIHPRPAAAGFTRGDVTVIVPAYREDPATVRRLAEAIGAVAEIVVVDDGSPDPIDVGEIASVVRLTTNQGPAAARNAGLAVVATELVLFIDADAVLDAAQLDVLLGHLDDERVAAVAPRVVPPPLGPGPHPALARYEAIRSPLDMGDSAALVRAGTRVSYVPSAVLLCRATALRELGGFDTSLRYGEDVDLVWRLAAAGWSCRYEPAAVAGHAVRTTMRAWLRQRFHYGTAAAALEQRHRGALAPVRVNRWSLAGWSAVALGHPVIGAGLATGSAVGLARTLAAPGAPPRWSAALPVTARANLHVGRQLADATTGVWWPAAIAAAILSKRARRALAAAVVIPAIAEWAVRRPPLGLVRFGMLRVLDRGAYGLGVWRGALDRRELGPLRPAIT